jgi:hypothetical protein
MTVVRGEPFAVQHIGVRDMTKSFEVDTKVFSSGMIEQVTEFNDNGVREQLTRKLIDTNEVQLREALIKLGWTPPETKDKVMELLTRIELKNDNNISNMKIRHWISECVVNIRKELLHHE